MTTDIKSTLLGSANKAALEYSAAFSNMFPSDRTMYPLAEFEGIFTGEEGVYNDVNQKTGEVYPKPTLIIKDVEVIRKTDSNYQPSSTYSIYSIVVDQPSADKFAQSRIGMMTEAALGSGAIKDWLGELVGQRCHFTIDAKKPWPTAKGYNFYYKVSKCAGGSQQAQAETNPDQEAHESAAIQFASGLTEAEFRSQAISELSSKGIQNDSLFAEIALGKFVDRAVAEGKLQIAEGVLAVVE